jgi:hypothetical protein
MFSASKGPLILGLVSIAFIAGSSAKGTWFLYPRDGETLQAVVDLAQDGDSIGVAGSDNPNLTIYPSGSPPHGARNLYIRGDPANRPSLREPGVPGAVLYIRDAGLTKIENFIIDGNAYPSNKTVLIVECPAILDNCLIKNGASGITLWNTNGALIRNCTITDMNQFGIDNVYSQAGLQNVWVSQGNSPDGSGDHYTGDWGCRAGASFAPFENVHGDQARSAGGRGRAEIAMKAFNVTDFDIVARAGVNYFPTPEVDAYLDSLRTNYPATYQSIPVPFFNDALIHDPMYGTGRIVWWLEQAEVAIQGLAYFPRLVAAPNPTRSWFVLRNSTALESIVTDVCGREVGRFSGNGYRFPEDVRSGAYFVMQVADKRSGALKVILVR